MAFCLHDVISGKNGGRDKTERQRIVRFSIRYQIVRSLLFSLLISQFVGGNQCISALIKSLYSSDSLHIATDPGFLAWLPSRYIQSGTKRHNHHRQPSCCPHEGAYVHHHSVSLHLNMKVVMVR